MAAAEQLGLLKNLRHVRADHAGRSLEDPESS
jgi:hypothetical protein